MSKLAEAFKDGPNLMACPNCGTTVPASIRVCWRCGEILDPGLKRLMEMKKNEA